MIDTSLASPDDIVESEADGKPVADGTRYPVGPFSLIMLVTEG